MIIATGPVMVGGRIFSTASVPNSLMIRPAAMETKPDITMPNCAYWIASVGSVATAPSCQASICAYASGESFSITVSLVTSAEIAVRYAKLDP